MQISSKSPYQAEISLKDGGIHIIGPLTLINRINDLKSKYGTHPKTWPEITTFKSAEDLLINEFILKAKDTFKLAYTHDELCHCRMVPADKVYSAIKHGCSSIEDVGRATLAGTGCGSCRDDIEKLLQQFKIK